MSEILKNSSFFNRLLGQDGKEGQWYILLKEDFAFQYAP